MLRGCGLFGRQLFVAELDQTAARIDQPGCGRSLISINSEMQTDVGPVDGHPPHALCAYNSPRVIS